MLPAELNALAATCFEQAERQDSPIVADALRERALRHLAQAHDAWRKKGDDPARP